MPRVFVVRPASGAWLVDDGAQVWVFAKGAEAERWARQAARAAAGDGQSVELKVMDLRGGLAGAILFRPPLAA